LDTSTEFFCGDAVVSVESVGRSGRSDPVEATEPPMRELAAMATTNRMIKSAYILAMLKTL